MLRDRSRLATIAVLGLLLLAGFAFGRLMAPQNAQAFNDPSVAGATSPSPTAAAAREADNFYLSDFKTGFGDGYNSALSGASTGVAATTRVGYNDGFKQGYSEGFQARVSETGTTGPTIVTQPSRERVVYRTTSNGRASFSERRGGSSKLKTALTIAAPAALGAGVGALVGGKKGAGAGALLGGGGGALYYLIKNR